MVGEAHPVLDEDGLLRLGERWVAIPDGQLSVVELLVERFGRTVSTEQIAAAYTSSGGSGHAASIRSLLTRLGRRVARLGLCLETVRGRGVMLVLAERGATAARR